MPLLEITPVRMPRKHKQSARSIHLDDIDQHTTDWSPRGRAGLPDVSGLIEHDQDVQWPMQRVQSQVIARSGRWLSTKRRCCWAVRIFAEAAH